MEEYRNNKYTEWEIANKTEGWITFFTPSYNRAPFLPRVYECLKKQTDKHFVWILVCDGSSDNSIEIANELLKREDFPMLFIYKDNGGKHSAFKVALESTHTEYFVCMDDDDLYSPKSTETFLREWERIRQEGKQDEVGAIRTLTRGFGDMKDPNEVVNDSEMFIDCSSLERIYIQKIKQENWTCYRTSSLRNIELFPLKYWLCTQHKFFNEGIWQGRFARKYKCRYINIYLRYYTQDAEVSLIRSKKSRQHYMDMFINSHFLMEEQFDFIRKSPLDSFKNMAIVGVLGRKLHIPLRDLWQNSSVIFRLPYTFFFFIGGFVSKPHVPQD